MPPQKRTILDFFAPVSKDVQAQGSTPEKAGTFAPTQSRHNPAQNATSISRDRSSNQTTPQQSKNGVAVRKPRPSASPSPPYPALSDNIAVSTPQSSAADTHPPPPSQSSANSAVTSKRVVSFDGEPMVLNSDTDSDESLPEFQWPGTNKPKATSPKVMIELKPKALRKDADLKKPPERKKNDKAFSVFVQKTQKSAEAERQIAEVKADLDKPLMEETPVTGHEVAEGLLANAGRDGDDPDRAKKLHLALQRTNALRMDCVFHVFREDGTVLPLKDSPFPLGSLPNHEWTSNFQEQSTRDQAFMTGFAQQVFRFQQLPEELALWMVDQVSANQSEALNDRYLHLLEAHHHHLERLLDEERLSSIFDSIGTDAQCLDAQQAVLPSLEAEQFDKRVLATSLISVCRLIKTAAPWLRIEARTRALWILLHVCMDDSVGRNTDTLHHVQDAIEALMCNVPDNKKLAEMLNDIVPSLLKRITHPILQRQLVASLPSWSPLTAYLQRLLALSFLLHPTPITNPLDDPEIPNLILDILIVSPNFRISRDTDYVSLSASITLLDMAIGPGPLTVPYQPLLSPPPSQHASPMFAPKMNITPEEKAFNKVVDGLAHGVQMVSDAMIDLGGLNDLSRMQAKDCCERVVHRLQNAVRIGGRETFDIFGNVHEEASFDTGVFKNFFREGNKTDASAVTDGDVGNGAAVIRGGE